MIRVGDEDFGECAAGDDIVKTAVKVEFEGFRKDTNADVYGGKLLCVGDVAGEIDDASRRALALSVQVGCCDILEESPTALCRHSGS